VFNSLLWGIAIAFVIGIFRRRRSRKSRADQMETPILE
jgi:hypothetical protein